MSNGEKTHRGWTKGMLRDRFIELFELQHALQTETYGYNFQQMTTTERIRYIKDMKLALDAELQEALSETSWKPWTNRRHYIRRDEYIGEMVDVLHFLINMLLVLGDDPKDLAMEVAYRYRQKHDVNRQRQVDGYDGVSTKCGDCGRALDDVAVMCSRDGDQGYCAQRGVDVNYLDAFIGPEVSVKPIKPTSKICMIPDCGCVGQAHP